MYIERGCEILEKIKLNEIRKEEKHYVAQTGKVLCGVPSTKEVHGNVVFHFFFLLGRNPTQEPFTGPSCIAALIKWLPNFYETGLSVQEIVFYYMKFRLFPFCAMINYAIIMIFISF